MPALESLEDRINPSVFVGTERTDSVAIFDIPDQNTTMLIALSRVDGGEGGLAGLSIASQVLQGEAEIQLLGGDDFVTNTSTNPWIRVDLGDGDDFFDGAEGSSVFVDGGDGNDTILGSSSDDVIIGGNGQDQIQARDGNDTIFGGSLLHPQSIDPAQEHYMQIVDISRYAQPVDDGAVDSIDAGRGFSVVYNDTTREVCIVHQGDGTIHQVGNTQEFLLALDAAQSGDQIRLAPGVYTLTEHIITSLPGISIIGDGANTVITGGGFFINNDSQPQPTLLQNFVIDLTGNLAYKFEGVRGYNVFRDGLFYFDQVEVFGLGSDTVSTAALQFAAGQDERTVASIANGYFHNTVADIISTAGSPNMDPQSIVVLYDNVGHTPGTASHHQVITAHFGFKVVDVGGHYWDAHTNVIAPDNVTTIDLYFTTVEAGPRKGSVLLTTTDSVVYGATMTDLYVTQVRGTIENSYLRSSTQLSYGRFLLVHTGAKLTGNRIEFQNTGYSAMPVSIVGDNAQVVDNVFENWTNQTIENLGTDNWIEGNEFI